MLMPPLPIRAALLLAALCTLAVLLATVMLFRRRARCTAHPWLYRTALSTLIALLCPTLLVAGHGGLPLPTITGAATVLAAVPLDELRLTWVGLGSRDAGVLLAPGLVSFALAMLVLCTALGSRTPAIPAWDE